MNEVVALRPDIALLQEVPGTNQVAQLATRLFGTNGSYVSGFDCAIVTRGSLAPQQVRAPFFVTAVWRPGTNTGFTLTSLRLVPPETRSDLWRPDAWRTYIENRMQRSRQLKEILTVSRHDLRPQIIGGDFNAPGGDAIYKLLDGYTDAYAVAGRGWGHTALNNIPIVRPDQIWTKGVVPCSARASRTLHSDHRLVIVEVKL